jgi:Cu(I)/Ag(I) efflux system membrane fusion protein
MSCCGKPKIVKYLWILIGVGILIVMILSLSSCGRKEEIRSSYYTCGMHPSVRVSPEEYQKGNVNCPICNMKLTPVYKQETKAKSSAAYFGCGMEGAEHVFFISEGELKHCPICGMPLKQLSPEEANELKGVVSMVKIEGEQLRLAGIMTEPAKRVHLFKKIRTVGKVAYDPELAVAQEEFISSLKAMDKIKQGRIPEIKERAAGLLESAKRKLRLLGLSEKQIEELANRREIQSSLILPEARMWIYADVYEYELAWVKEGERIKVTTASLPGEEFQGIISSLNPVVDPKTRAVRLRAEVDNPGLRLKPQMYVDVVIETMYMGPGGEHLVLAIPKDAVLDTGTRKIVWVDKGNQEFEGRKVQVGPEATAEVKGRESKFYPVLQGLSEGEVVVTKANFLIDSQSQITGIAASAFGGALGTEEQKPAPPVHQH